MNRQTYKKVIKLQRNYRGRKGSNKSDIEETPAHSRRNSFLVEIEYNHDIDKKTRKDIEDKYWKSSINKHYVFPRQSGGDQLGLPKIRFEKRNISQVDSSLLSISPMPANVNLSFELKNDLGVSSKRVNMPSLSRKIKLQEKKYTHSVTPCPSVIDSKKNYGNSYKEMRGNAQTPSPYQSIFLIKPDKKRFL